MFPVFNDFLSPWYQLTVIEITPVRSLSQDVGVGGERACRNQEVDRLSLACPDERDLDDPYGLVLTQRAGNNDSSPHHRPVAFSAPSSSALTLAVFSPLGPKLRWTEPRTPAPYLPRTLRAAFCFGRWNLPWNGVSGGPWAGAGLETSDRSCLSFLVPGEAASEAFRGDLVRGSEGTAKPSPS